MKVVYDEKNRVAQKQYRVDGTGHQTKYLYGEVSKQQKPGLEYGVQVDGKTCIEYAGLMGVPIPEVICKTIEVLEEKGKGSEGSNLQK